VKKILAGKGNFGFNALSLDFEQDMIKAGVITPTKVERSALQNAASVAALLLTTDALLLRAQGQGRRRRPPGGEWVAWAAAWEDGWHGNGRHGCMGGMM